MQLSELNHLSRISVHLYDTAFYYIVLKYGSIILLNVLTSIYDQLKYTLMSFILKVACNVCVCVYIYIICNYTFIMMKLYFITFKRC